MPKKSEQADKTATKKTTVRKKTTAKKTVARKKQPAKKSTVKKTVRRKKAAPVSKISSEERHAMIAIHAYYQAEADGFQQGTEFDHWLQAEKEIDAMLGLSK